MEEKVWFSRRAIKLHVVILIGCPHSWRCASGRSTGPWAATRLSWAYVFEWPFFAGYAVYMWWRFVHEAAEDTPPPGTPAPIPRADRFCRPGDTPAPRRRPGAGRGQEMAAYNHYLAQLAERDNASGR